ncbi:U11/U12 small nuclear ribonucleoprotein 65 kDa protein [Iris pallida]|uniref:U11/U12 small nuclear ribonucleoprotein 65 kDa protein n=1 Tax=Iris pallida TaxID=29817 RepID=A0AAX6E690_IRIPA|nr:U11/U12 small nuclear ribonucleoprotein 65 kDa protein [Iris pallida]
MEENFRPYFHQPQPSQNPNQEPPPPPLPSMSSGLVPEGAAATLLVKHLPEAIPHDVLSRLFARFGASSVRPCAGGKLRNCAFVDFNNEVLASQAQAQVNRLRFLGKVLVVERAGRVGQKDAGPQGEGQGAKGSGAPPAFSAPKGSVSAGEPIAPRLGVDYPFPPNLEYEYPPPDGNILTNIVNALIAVPLFYTQVLHLMNKMNIPAPFRMALPTPPLPPPVPAPSPPPPPVAAKLPVTDLSSDESEMESSEEDADDNRSRKRVKREAIVGPGVDKDVPHEAVGLKPATLVPKEVPLIKKKHPVLQIKIASKPTQKEITDDDGIMKELVEQADDHMEEKPYATPKDIESGRLHPEEILCLPMFKNYAAGNPATVLYIKNLAKDVVVDDFYFIFGSLFGSFGAAKSGLSIKLMQEGRMRGQAFVTFPSIDLAHHALNLVNGYMFKGKPMIIQFGRNPSSAKTN